MSLKISYVVSCYNNEYFISECIESILNQKEHLNKYEVIVVDDASTDKTNKILTKYNDHPNIKIIKKVKNEGLLASRKTGFSYSSGEYIQFVDGDDMVQNDHLINLSNSLTANADVLCFAYEEHSDTKKFIKKNSLKNGLYFGSDINIVVNEMIKKNNTKEHGIFPYVWCKTFKRSILNDVFEDISEKIFIGEDGRISYACLRKSNLVIISSFVGYKYRQHSSSSLKTSGNTLKELEGIKLLRKELKEEFYRYPNKIIEDIDWYISCLIQLRLSPFKNCEILANNVYNFNANENLALLLLGDNPYNHKMIGWIKEIFSNIHCEIINDPDDLVLKKYSGLNFKKIYILGKNNSFENSQNNKNQDIQVEYISSPYADGIKSDDIDQLLGI